jgi:hypothetical protein
MGVIIIFRKKREKQAGKTTSTAAKVAACWCDWLVACRSAGLISSIYRTGEERLQVTTLWRQSVHTQSRAEDAHPACYIVLALSGH